MLIRVEDDGALAIGQLSHSWLAGQLARAWGNERFPAPEPREDIVLGAEQHDIGWALFDRDPGWSSETGLPRSFLQLSADEHLAIWRDAPDRLMSQSTFAAFVVSLHGRSLSELRASNASPEDERKLRAHAEDEGRRQARLCEALGISESLLRRTQRQMWTWDGLSLALCHAWQPFTARDVPASDGLLDIELRESAAEPGALTLEPWPFAQRRIELRCEARPLASRYADAELARSALAAARPVGLDFTLVA